MAFRFSIDDAKAGEHTEMPGTWATDKILAKGINQTLVGFRTGTDAVPGDEVWKLRLAGPICGYTRHATGENRTAVVFRDSKDKAGPTSLLYPLHVSGSRLLALRMSDDRISPSALVSLDPKTGKETPYLYFGVPQDADTLTTLDENDIVVQDGRLFFAAHAADGPSGGKAWTWLVLGIGRSATKQ
ncbi:hypothetical protein ACFWOB_42785 [Streptomyces sp. NPDC058420]|uniref:hypothetical protein n=1 Tax=Streptomyces sp. NPDC058420 TaxID=3346489 RepID=UPI003648F27F